MVNNKSSNENIENINTTSSSNMEIQTLTEEQKLEVITIANEIDINNMESVFKFGSDIQNKLKHFNHELLVQVQSFNTNNIRETLFTLQNYLEQMNTDQLLKKTKNPFSKLFSRNKKSTQMVISEYNRLSKIVDKITIQLQHAQHNLIQDNQLLDKVFEQNNQFFNQLTLHIFAAEKRKSEFIQKELKQYKKTYELTNHPMDLQKYEDAKNIMDMLDKRMYDMQISKEIALQTAPQIRMIQQTNNILLEKIQTSILTTIPLWQAQISMIINLNKQQHIQQAANKLEKQFSSGLEQSNTDLESTINELKKTQFSLITSIEDALNLEAENTKQQIALEQTIEK